MTKFFIGTIVVFMIAMYFFKGEETSLYEYFGMMLVWLNGVFLGYFEGKWYGRDKGIGECIDVIEKDLKKEDK